jgi:virginiamycin B lyase
VIVGPDDVAWITDGGLNAIVRVEPRTEAVEVFPLPADRPDANLNTAAFDARGAGLFTGQNGVYGRLDPGSGEMAVFDAPRGRGPYGITTTPDGEIYFVSLAGSYLASVDLESGRRRSSSHRRQIKARAESGRTLRAGCGSASGTRARSEATTPLPASGGSGLCPVTTRGLTPSTSTSATRYG